VSDFCCPTLQDKNRNSIFWNSFINEVTARKLRHPPF
jgi:hypothetical protein